MSEKKERKKREPKYVTDNDKKQHFIDNTNKCVEIIDRQLRKLSFQAKGRTYIYTPQQIETLTEYLHEKVDKVKDRLLRTVEEAEKFNVGE